MYLNSSINCDNISQYYHIYYIFDQMQACLALEIYLKKSYQP